MKRKTDTSPFLLGSLLLTLSAAGAKLCGALFRIPLTSLLGGTGMGYFSTAYGLFMPLYAILVTGISTACAQLTAQRTGIGDADGAQYIRHAAGRLFLGTGLLGTAAAVLAAKPFTRLSAGDTAAFPAVLAIAPCVLLCSVTAAERGCREGLCDMKPTAVSQLLEAVTKLVCGLWLCRRFLHEPPAFLRGYPREAAGACGAVLGVTLSALAGMLLMLLLGGRRRRPVQHPPLGRVLREMLGILLPAALGALVTDLTSFLDLLTVMRMLPAGCDPTFVYGSFMGMAVTVFGLVPSLTNMLARSALPCVAQCCAKRDRAGAALHARQLLALTGLVCIPAACGLFVLPDEALRFLFAGREAEIRTAAEGLRMLAPGLVCLCLVTPVFALLQAAGRADLPVKLMLPGLLVKLAGNLLLLPRCGIAGAALSTSLCYAVILVPSLCCLRHTLGEPLHLGKILLPEGFGGVLCGAAAWVVCGRLGMLPQRVAFLCAVLAGAGVYALVILLFRLDKGRGVWYNLEV